MSDTASVIAQIESGDNPQAMRFEPLVYANAAGAALGAKIAKIHGCSGRTAEMIYATSWGAYQIMGITLYDLGYAKTVFDFVAAPNDQRAMFDAFCASRGIAFTIDQLRDSEALRLRFATKYNGPGNITDYAARIAAEITRQL